VESDERKRKRAKGSAPGPPPERGKPSGPSLGRQLLFWAFLVGGLLLVLSLVRTTGRVSEEEVDLIRFQRHLEARDLQKIHVKGAQVVGVLKPDRAPYRKIKLTHSRSYIDAHLDEWMQYLPQDQKDALVVKESSGMVPLIIANVVPFLLLILLMIYLFNRQFRAVNARSKNTTEQAQKEKPEVTFDDVAGVDEAKEEVQEIVEFLSNPEKFRRIGGRIPRGVLLVGRPGTGKTLLAKAIAGEADVPFYSLSGSDFVELFVGVGASRVRDLFQRARESQPCIIFLDEIDAVGRKRGAGLGGGHDEREQTLNAILSEMDGFSRQTGIIVIAATNRPDVLDSALLRPGRFDREVVVDMPDLKGRGEILRIHARKVKIDAPAKLDILARGTPGFSGADLEAVINEGAIIAAMKGKSSVGMEDLEEARDKVRFGRKKRSRVMSEEDRRVTAYHEAGHALVAKLHPDVEPLHKVTIVPRGAALGMTMILPEGDKYGLRRKECLGILTMNMAGRVSEELFCADISSGAKNDIDTATDLARKMVTQWGMSDRIGPVSYSEQEEHVFLGTEIARGKRHSEKTTQEIDEEIGSFVRSGYEKAREMCQEHADKLKVIAEALLIKETLTAVEVDRIFHGASAADLTELAQKTGPDETARADKVLDDKDKPSEKAAAEGYPQPEGSPA